MPMGQRDQWPWKLNSGLDCWRTVPLLKMHQLGRAVVKGEEGIYQASQQAAISKCQHQNGGRRTSVRLRKFASSVSHRLSVARWKFGGFVYAVNLLILF